MKEITTKLLVIGGGPGGYVAAIRAGQLGVPTVLVEGESLGGTCLNIGCIPSKALIHAAHAFDAARHQAHGSPLGIKVQEPAIDIAQTVRWKDGIVKRLTGGGCALAQGRRAGAQPRLFQFTKRLNLSRNGQYCCEGFVLNIIAVAND